MDSATVPDISPQDVFGKKFTAAGEKQNLFECAGRKAGRVIQSDDEADAHKKKCESEDKIEDHDRGG